MHLFVWRHSKRFSSWSMLDEPHIHKENYLQADVTVLAPPRRKPSPSWHGPATGTLRNCNGSSLRLSLWMQPRIVISHVDFQ